MSELILYGQDDPVLLHLAKTLRVETRIKRIRYGARILQIRAVVAKVLAHHSDVADQITRIQNRMRTRQQGIPSTESVDALQTADVLKTSLSDGEKFLLKKAYKMAASLTHPDRGGSKEDFQQANAAYRVSDIASLRELVLTYQGTLNDKLNYWHTELKKPEIEWRLFQSTPEHAIAQLYMQGRQQQAIDLAGRILQVKLAEVMATEMFYSVP